MTAKLAQAEILGFIPHRYENVLVDGVDREESTCTATLALAEDDPAGRDIFLRTAPDGTSVLEHVIPEHLALASLCQLGDIGEGKLAFFSSITNFQRTALIPAGQPLRSELKRERDRGMFRRFKGKTSNAQGVEVASANIMAFILDTTAAQPQDEGKKAELPPMTGSSPVSTDRYRWKRPEMCFVSACRHLDLQARQATLSYVYPADHPLTKGHFPGNPVMMGITQWIGASDAADWLAFALIEAGQLPCPGQIKADITLLKPDGAAVAEIAGLVNAYDRDADGRVISQTLATKRIGFRDMVRPGEEIIYAATIQGAD